MGCVGLVTCEGSHVGRCRDGALGRSGGGMGGAVEVGCGQCQVEEVAAHTHCQALGSFTVIPDVSLCLLWPRWSRKEALPLCCGTHWGNRIYKD